MTLHRGDGAPSGVAKLDPWAKPFESWATLADAQAAKGKVKPGLEAFVSPARTPLGAASEAIAAAAATKRRAPDYYEYHRALLREPPPGRGEARVRDVA